MMSDNSVRATDTDASLARLSAVNNRYLLDPFIRLFVPRAHLQQPRPPLINIGTYVRSESIDRLVHAWINLSIKRGSKYQIVSLGAGSDTRFWRLANGKHKEALAKYVEVDFPEITAKKAMAIKKNNSLSSVLGDPDQVSLGNGGTALFSPFYTLFAADLRTPPSHSLAPLLSTTPLLDPKLPTLILCECVLAYMHPAASSALFKWFADQFREVGAVVYEMFGLGDAFGKVMKANLMTRGIELPGVEPYTTREELTRRFEEHGFPLARALTLKEIRNARIPKDELVRISQLEMLDEVEELDLVLDHYAITWGAVWPEGEGEGGWAGWDMVWDRDRDPGSTSGDE